MRYSSMLTAGLLITGTATIAPAQTNPDALAYVPIPPCRVVDTRLVGDPPGSPLPAGVPRNVRVKAVDLSDQGGSAAGCSVPATAAAVLLSVSSIGATGEGSVKVWAYPVPKPSDASSVLSYGAVQGLGVITNGDIAVPLCNPAASTCEADLVVVAQASDTHVVVDVVGVFVPALTSGAVGPTGRSG